MTNTQLYMVDTNSFLVSHWPGFVFFLGTTRNPLLYESDSPISKVFPLPEGFEEEAVPFFCSKYRLEAIIRSKSVPILCVTNPNELIDIQSALMDSGLYFTELQSETFRLDPEVTLTELNEFALKDFPPPKLEQLPKTNPLLDWKRGPYIDHKWDLIISQSCDQVWKYWLGGLSPAITIKCFSYILEPDMYQKIKKKYNSSHFTRPRHNMTL